MFVYGGHDSFNYSNPADPLAPIVVDTYAAVYVFVTDVLCTHTHTHTLAYFGVQLCACVCLHVRPWKCMQVPISAYAFPHAYMIDAGALRRTDYDQSHSFLDHYYFLVKAVVMTRSWSSG